jgi:hypothetical protein
MLIVAGLIMQARANHVVSNGVNNIPSDPNPGFEPATFQLQAQSAGPALLGLLRARWAEGEGLHS